MPEVDSYWPDPMFAEDLARIRGSSLEAIYTARLRGQLPPASRLGRRLAWRRSDVEAWFAERQELRRPLLSGAPQAQTSRKAPAPPEANPERTERDDSNYATTTR